MSLNQLNNVRFTLANSLLPSPLQRHNPHIVNVEVKYFFKVNSLLHNGVRRAIQKEHRPTTTGDTVIAMLIT